MQHMTPEVYPNTPIFIKFSGKLYHVLIKYGTVPQDSSRMWLGPGTQSIQRSLRKTNSWPLHPTNQHYLAKFVSLLSLHFSFKSPVAVKKKNKFLCSHLNANSLQQTLFIFRSLYPLQQTCWVTFLVQLKTYIFKENLGHCLPQCDTV